MLPLIGAVDGGTLGDADSSQGTRYNVVSLTAGDENETGNGDTVVNFGVIF